jgi:Na+/H+ antiporter NhaD/arsenite permease-like protein
VTAALIVFALTYLAVAAGRVPWLSIDRPAAALLGAVLMVATGVLLPAEASAAVNGDTLGLLLGMMILAAYLGEAGFFRWASWRVIRAAGTPRSLLWGLTLAAGLLSAFLVNDTVCLLMTPLVVRIVEDAELPPIPYLLAIAFGSNAGSVATLTGNPQNMLVGTLSGITYLRFAGALALPAAASLLVVAAVLHWQFRGQLPRRPLTNAALAEPPLDLGLLRRALLATALALAGFLSGFNLAWTALFAAALLMAVAGRAPRQALARVDWPLLLFFAGLFVVVAGVGRSGLAERLYQAFAPWLGATTERQLMGFSFFTVLASQVVSNVPFVLLASHWIPRLAEPELLWLATALASTLAGNLTVVGSVANLIVLELAGPAARIGFWRFLRSGAVVTGATLVVGLAILLAERGLGLI